jgi:hypothetical protein
VRVARLSASGTAAVLRVRGLQPRRTCTPLGAPRPIISRPSNCIVVAQSAACRAASGPPRQQIDTRCIKAYTVLVVLMAIESILTALLRCNSLMILGEIGPVA